MTNPNMYPITAAFEGFCEEHLGTNIRDGAAHEYLPEKRLPILQLARTIAETIGEYEHGTANPEDVFGNVEGLDLSEIYDAGERNRLCLRLYVKVCEDLLLTLINKE